MSLLQIDTMVGKKNGKGKPGVSSKGVSKVEVPEDGSEELGDPGQGGSGARTEDRELVVDADAGLVMEMSAEQRAVEKATEVQEELDTVALENEALKRELRAAKGVLEKRSEKEELMAQRAELEKRIAKAGQREDEWALKGGDRREASRGGSVDRSRSRSRGSRVESTGSRRGSLPRLPEGWTARRLSSRSRSPRRRVVIRSPGRGTKRRTSPGISSPRRPRTPPRRSPPRRTLSGRTSPRTSPGRRLSRRARSRERGEQDLSTRRLSGEIAILKRQVELQKKQRKPW